MSETTGAMADFAAMLGDLAPDPCRIGWSPIDPSTVAALTVGEAASVERAVASRRSEFGTGRALLRRLLGDDVEILRRPNGAPALPPDVCGSVAHDRDLVVAVIAPADQVVTIGLDVEPDEPVEQAVADLIIRRDDVVPDPLTAFVAKEAAYKSWSSLGGAMLEHHDVNVAVEGLRFVALFPDETTVAGRLGRAGGRIVALAISPAI